jgi:hypothetical protein
MGKSRNHAAKIESDDVVEEFNNDSVDSGSTEQVVQEPPTEQPEPMKEQIEEPAEQVAEAPKGVNVSVLMSELKTKSAVIRHLNGLGMKTGEINKAFATAGIKMIYQHVRNVLNQPLKKKSTVTETVTVLEPAATA